MRGCGFFFFQHREEIGAEPVSDRVTNMNFCEDRGAAALASSVVVCVQDGQCFSLATSDENAAQILDRSGAESSGTSCASTTRIIFLAKSIVIVLEWSMFDPVVGAGVAVALARGIASRGVETSISEIVGVCFYPPARGLDCCHRGLLLKKQRQEHHRFLLVKMGENHEEAKRRPEV